MYEYPEINIFDAPNSYLRQLAAKPPSLLVPSGRGCKAILKSSSMLLFKIIYFGYYFKLF
jgi:hypothetical protein